MKITFLLPHTRISGGVKALLEYANRLHKMGFTVNIVIPAPETRWYRRMFGAWLNGGTTSAPVDWFENKVPILVAPKLLSRYMPKADILVASSWQTAHAAADMPSDVGKKFYFVQHHESLWTREKGKAERTYRLPLTKLVISTWLKEIMMNVYRQESHLFVTPVDQTRFFCEKKQWNLPRKVCLLHHDYDWKGFAEGMQAIQRVRSQGHKLEPVVFGEKADDPRPLFESAGFEFEYHYRPDAKRLQKIYSACDIYLCPSWYEGLGMPAMEAMACRCALVTTDTGGCRDYAIDGQTALVSEPRDVAGLAKNLISLLTTDSLLEKLSENGYRKIREFGWEDNCRRLARLFEQA